MQAWCSQQRNIAANSIQIINSNDNSNHNSNELPQVLLDKNPSIRTVVTKLGSIENEFRVFDMEVIAGERQLETEVQQHKAKFRLDYSQARGAVPGCEKLAFVIVCTSKDCWM